jgi:hypothetical protein
MPHLHMYSCLPLQVQYYNTIYRKLSFDHGLYIDEDYMFHKSLKLNPKRKRKLLEIEVLAKYHSAYTPYKQIRILRIVSVNKSSFSFYAA